jgi:hypothetical protein
MGALPNERNSIKELRGIVLSVDGISADGEMQMWDRFSVDIESGPEEGEFTLDVRRLGDGRSDDVWSLRLADVEEALRTLKRWRRP